MLSVGTCKFWVKLEERIGKSCTFARFLKTKAASAVILSEKGIQQVELNY
jgi:hypothetical protein